MTVYRDSKEIFVNKDDLQRRHQTHQSYFLRSGKVFTVVENFDKEVKILELGCGGGQLSRTLFKAGYKNLDFVDIDDYLAFEDLKALQRLKLADLNCEPLPYADESFDLVLAIAIIEHVENPFHLKREISRVLKSGGTLIMSIPHAFNIFDRFKFLFTGNVSGYNLNNNHIAFQTKDIFCKCWLNDFDIAKIFVSPGFVKFLKFKIKFPDRESINKWLGRSACYILRKK